MFTAAAAVATIPSLNPTKGRELSRWMGSSMRLFPKDGRKAYKLQHPNIIIQEEALQILQGWESVLTN